jgi:hypothetical protein
MIDVSKIRVGDEVTVRAKVTIVHHDDPRNPIRLHGGTWVTRGDIFAHHPAPRQFKPGDRVLDNGYSGPVAWFIVHVKDGSAWIDDANGYSRIARLHNLRHADESE